MNVGIIIPDRRDRPQFLENCLRMMDRQTLKPDRICVMEYAPESDKCDITQRYRRGYHHLCGKDLDIIAFIENDDYYSPEYLEYMVNKWQEYGKPDIFGTNYTIYYHLKLGAHFTMYHQDRASAMNTLIKPDLDINWPVDHEPFTDMHLWANIKGITFMPEKVIAIGMKHGIGLCGGKSHVDKLYRYTNNDDGFLQRTVDEDSYKFYSQFYEPNFINTPQPQ
jgi:glycosyltransferase involved in cell wall biosynthesis